MYPIVDNGKTIYIISVSSRNLSFSSSKDECEKYKMVLDEFAKRIKLELSLQTILELERERT